jgi:sulfur-carrier protein adenylyltransferase/sulfurtransferase
MNINVKQLNDQINSDSPPIIIDIREPDELKFSSILSAIHIPMNELNEKIPQYSRDDKLVIMCRSGMRSSSITRALINAGYKNVKNLSGGINEWARQIDKSLKIY